MSIEEKTYKTDNRTGINHEGPRANTPVERLTATSVIGDRVENPQGEELGKIDNLMINLQTNQIEYAVIEFWCFPRHRCYPPATKEMAEGTTRSTS